MDKFCFVKGRLGMKKKNGKSTKTFCGVFSLHMHVRKINRSVNLVCDFEILGMFGINNMEII